MKIRVKVGDLVDQITQAAITIDRKFEDMPSSKVYQRAKLNLSNDGSIKPALYLFSTDQASKTFIRVDVDSVDTEGQVLVDPAKVLGGLLNRDPGQIVELEVLEDKTKEEGNPKARRIRMKIGKNIVHLPYEDSVDTAVAIIKTFSSLGPPIAKIAAKSLMGFIRRSLFCIPTGDNGQQKFAMGVLNLKSSDGYYIAQATDGFIIALHKAKQTESTKYDLPSSLLIPVEALNPLYKLLKSHDNKDVDILPGARNSNGELQEVFFRMEGVMFGTVLKVGAYPPLQKLLDQHLPSFEITVAKEELKGTLARAANFVENNKDRRIVKLTADATALQVEARNPHSDLLDEIEVKKSSSSPSRVEVSVNIDYLSNIASMQVGDRVSMGFNVDKTKALYIKDTSEEGVETHYAVMPVVPDSSKPKETAKKSKSKPVEELELVEAAV